MCSRCSCHFCVAGSVSETARTMNVPGSLAKCLRILMHVNTDRPLADIKHVYLRGARVLRRDLIGDEES